MARQSYEILSGHPRMLRISIGEHSAELRLPASPMMVDSAVQSLIERIAGATKAEVFARATALLSEKGNYA